MILYICLTIWFFILLLLGLRKDSILLAEIWPKLPEEKSIRRNHYIVSALVAASLVFLWFLTAFRSSAIGNDTENYLKMFNIFSAGLSKEFRFEVGYQLLNYFISLFTHDHHVFLIAMATIMYGLLGLYIFKFSKNPAVSLCLFYSCFFSFYTSILRQGMAMLVVLYGFQFLKNGKKIPAALLFLFATLFHRTAIVSILLLVDLKIWQKLWVVVGLTALCAAFSRLGLVKAAVDLIIPRYSYYFATEYASSGWLAISYYILLYLVMYFFVNRSFIEDYRPDRAVATNFALLLFFTAFGYALNLFDRVGEYFLLVGITEFPNMLYRGKVKHFRLWLLSICTVMLIMFILILIFRPGWNHMYPYEFWPGSIFSALN